MCSDACGTHTEGAVAGERLGSVFLEAYSLARGVMESNNYIYKFNYTLLKLKDAKVTGCSGLTIGK